ncbi:MAG TPA: site-2 protease family protein [Candidatus Omnitrophica bacterium]|nr:site-2 protease family protein [Candidatus Omnitrophota bacterium]
MFLQTAILAYIVLLGSVVFHEFSHAWMARKLGDESYLVAERLTLNPLPHIDILGTVILPFSMLLFRSPFLFGWAKPVAVNPSNLKNPKKDMLWIGFSGPATNFLLAFFFTLVFKIPILNSGSLAEAFVALAILLNLILGVFNLIPLPPLDGSHIVSGLLPPNLETGYNRIRPFAPFILIFLILTGILGSLIYPVIYLWTALFKVNFVNPAIFLLRG